MRRVLLYTATGVRNLGDECILRAEYDFLRARYPNAQIRVATYDPASHLLPKDDPRLAFFPYFPKAFRRHPFANAGYFFRNLVEAARADLVVVGGGGLFYDNEAGQSFRTKLWQWKLRVFCARFFGAKILFWAVGIDLREANLKRLAGMFSGAGKAVSVRDSRSQALLRSVGVESALVRDPVFLLPHRERIHHKTRPKVGLALRSGYLPNEDDTVERMLRFLQAEGFEPVLLAHSVHPDGGATDDVARFAEVAERLSVRQLPDIESTFAAYRELDFVISMRLHASILAFVQHVPFYPVSYAKKTDEVLREIVPEGAQAAARFDVEAFKSQFLRLAANAAAQRLAIAEKSRTIGQSARLTYNSLFDGLESLGRKGERIRR